ncbi:MAG: transcription-repair coupling factor [Planctomycetes bacterium]|nr:transcription-repair coupling factor [Planctomycetota bacterium]
MPPAKKEPDEKEGGEMFSALGCVRASRVAKETAKAIEGGGRITIGNLWGASGAMLTAALTGMLRDKTFLVITAGADLADTTAADMEAFLGTDAGSRVVPFPSWDILPEEAEEPDIDVLSSRLSFLEDFGAGIRTGIAPIEAVLQRVPRREELKLNVKEISAGTELDLTEFAEWLGGNEYRREVVVSAPGEFAVRGGVIDVWALYGSGHGNRPVRIEFAADTVESIRTFEPTGQRSIEEIRKVRIGGEPSHNLRGRESAYITSYMDAGKCVMVLADCQAVEETEGAREVLETWDGAAVRMSEVLEEGAEDAGVRSVERYSGHPERIAETGGTTYIAVSNRGLLRKIRETVEEKAGRRENVFYAGCHVSGGFQWTDPDFTVLTDGELLDRPRARRRIPQAVPTRKLVDVLELEPGDYVVHVTQGIARYGGIERLETRGRTEEYLSLQFAEQAKLYVPLAQMYLVQKYIGGKEEPPDLSKIGSTRWKRRKERAMRAARDTAAELLETHARRQAIPGIPYPYDDSMQEEFEEAFPYEDTPDQAAATKEIKRDMEAPSVMERLLCGDVGFGKTEIALRAIYKCVAAGRQAAVLVPTTILAEQHLRTFRERLEPFAVTADMLNRYRTRGEQKRIVESLREGRLDVVVGTSRLIQGDVGFRRLGLLVIDEEQRFGVAQKERLKRKYPAVDVLMLSATPIPRTLHMALAGIKDISTLATPPPDRHAIRTAVIRKNPDIIRRAILREMGRGGQVFYLHNRIQSLEGVARELSAIVPEAAIITVHGRMKDRELADNMYRFLSGEADVLASTSIVESGLDITSVNTILIDDPERYGLSELHQLRGRVGRYHQRAYCYLLIPAHARMGMKARRRLKAVEELQHLGAGFDIAVRDMELRGIGNILGAEQSGHIAEVGYELYMDLLTRAVKELKGESVREAVEVTVHLAEASYIPEDYIPDTAVRIDAYRAISSSGDAKTLEEVKEEFRDRFGALPLQAENLFMEAGLGLMCRRAGVLYLGTQDGRLVMRFERLDPGRLERRWKELAPEVRFPGEDTATIGLPDGSAAAEEAGRLLKHLGQDVE